MQHIRRLAPKQLPDVGKECILLLVVSYRLPSSAFTLKVSPVQEFVAACCLQLHMPRQPVFTTKEDDDTDLHAGAHTQVVHPSCLLPQ